MLIKIKLNTLLCIILILSLLTDAMGEDYGYFYDNPKEEILFDTAPTYLSTLVYPEKELLISSNLQTEYFSSAAKNKFKIEYYTCPINIISSSPISLIKVTFNITEPEEMTVKEVIMNLYDEKEKKIVFPKKNYDEFTIEQNRTSSNDGRKNRSTIIYDTFGFNIKSKNNINFKIAKLLLVNFRKKKLNYLANLSGNVKNTYDGDNNTFNIYLKNMPEDFDLYVTLEIFDNNWIATGEKILVVQKDFNYPNYKIEVDNPNKNFFIISLTFIIIALILTAIFIILKFICG